MSSAPWSNETERADYYKKLYTEQLAICDRIEKEIESFEMVIGAIEDHINPLPFETDYAKAIRQAKSEAVKEFAERLKEKFTHLEYVINSSRKTIPIQTVKAEVDAILQNGCSNVIDSVRKEMEVD